MISTGIQLTEGGILYDQEKDDQEKEEFLDEFYEPIEIRPKPKKKKWWQKLWPF